MNSIYTINIYESVYTHIHGVCVSDGYALMHVEVRGQRGCSLEFFSTL